MPGYFFTVREIYLFPIGLSFVSKMVPRKVSAIVKGIRLLSTSCRNDMVGFLASYDDHIGVKRFFELMIVLLLAATAILMVLARRLRQTVKDI